MQTVQLPNTVESLHRAFSEVLIPYLSSGNSQNILGNQIEFYNCELFYHLEKIQKEPGDAPVNKPFIVFAGSRIGSTKQYKASDPTLSRSDRSGNEVRQRLYKTVYVGVSRSLKINLPPYSEPANTRLANLSDPDQIWSQLWIVLSYLHRSFYDRGIYYPDLTPVPVPVPSEDYYLVSGSLEMEVRYQFRREN